MRTLTIGEKKAIEDLIDKIDSLRSEPCRQLLADVLGDRSLYWNEILTFNDQDSSSHMHPYLEHIQQVLEENIKSLERSSTSTAQNDLKVLRSIQESLSKLDFDLIYFKIGKELHNPYRTTFTLMQAFNTTTSDENKNIFRKTAVDVLDRFSDDRPTPTANRLKELMFLAAFQDEEVCGRVQEKFISLLRDSPFVEEVRFNCLAEMAGRFRYVRCFKGQSYSAAAVPRVSDYNLVEIVNILITRMGALHEKTKETSILIRGLTAISRVVDDLVDIRTGPIAADTLKRWKESLRKYAEDITNNTEVVCLAEYALKGVKHLSKNGTTKDIVWQSIMGGIEGLGLLCSGAIVVLSIPFEGPLFLALAIPIVAYSIKGTLPVFREILGMHSTTPLPPTSRETISEILNFLKYLRESKIKDWYLFLRCMREGLLLWLSRQLEDLPDSEREEHENQFIQFLKEAEDKGNITEDYRFACVHLLEVVTYFLTLPINLKQEQAQRLIDLFIRYYREIENDELRRQILNKLDYLLEVYSPENGLIAVSSLGKLVGRAYSTIADSNIPLYQRLKAKSPVEKIGGTLGNQEFFLKHTDCHELLDEAVQVCFQAQGGMTPYQRECLAEEAECHLLGRYEQYKIPRLLPGGCSRTILPYSPKYIHLTMVQEYLQKLAMVEEFDITAPESGRTHLLSSGVTKSFIGSQLIPIQLNEFWHPPSIVVDKPTQPETSELVQSSLVIGEAGIGKTTFANTVARLVMRRELWQTENIKWVFLISLRNLLVYDSKDCQLSDIVYRECFRDYFSPSEFQRFWSTVSQNPKQALWIFDGYDEIAHLHTPSGGQRFLELFNVFFRPPKQSAHPLVKRCIITSRHYSTEGLFSNIAYRVTGFSKEDVGVYIDCFFHEDPIRARSLRTLFVHNMNLLNIAQIPINLQSICVLHQMEKLSDPASEASSSSASIFTMTKLYQKLINYLLLRYFKERNPNIGEAAKANLTVEMMLVSPPSEQINLFLNKLAFEMIKRHGVPVTTEELNKLLVDFGIRSLEFSSIIEASGLLNATPDTETMTKVYNFLHPTFRDFFAARYVAEQLMLPPGSPSQHEVVQFIRDNKVKGGYSEESDDYEIVWWFTSGLLKDQEDEWSNFIKLLFCNGVTGVVQESSKRFCLLVRCIEEGEKADKENIRFCLGEIKQFVINYCDSSREKEFTSFGIPLEGEPVPPLMTWEWFQQPLRSLQTSSQVLERSKVLNKLEEIMDMDSMNEGGCYSRVVSAAILGEFAQVSGQARVIFFKFHKDLDVRVRSIIASRSSELAEENDEARKLLFEFCKDPDINIRLAAIKKLEELGEFAKDDPSVQEVLFDCCRHPVASVRKAVVKWLVESAKKSPKARDLFFELCENPDIKVQLAAVSNLGKLGKENEDVRTTLFKFCKDLNVMVRETAVGQLSELAKENTDARQLFFRLCTDSNAKVRLSVVEGMGRLAIEDSEARKLLLGLCEDLDIDVQSAAVRMLRVFPKEDIEVQNLLRCVRKSKEKDVQVAAIFVLSAENSETRESFQDRSSNLVNIDVPFSPDAPLATGTPKAVQKRAIQKQLSSSMDTVFVGSSFSTDVDRDGRDLGTRYPSFVYDGQRPTISGALSPDERIQPAVPSIFTSGLKFREIQGDLCKIVAYCLGHVERASCLRVLVAYMVNNSEKYRVSIELPGMRNTAYRLLADARNETWEKFTADLKEPASIQEQAKSVGADIERYVLMYLLDRPIAVIGSDEKIRNQREFTEFKGEPIFVYCFNSSDGNDYNLLLPGDRRKARDILTVLKWLSDHSSDAGSSEAASNSSISLPSI